MYNVIKGIVLDSVIRRIYLVYNNVIKGILLDSLSRRIGPVCNVIKGILLDSLIQMI